MMDPLVLLVIIAVGGLAGFIAWAGRKALVHNPIHAFALLIVATISVYVMWMGFRLTEVLASPGWCSKALQAERMSNQDFGGLTGCLDILKIQLQATAFDSHISHGVVALCLLTLIVIVIAKGQLFVKAGKDGVNVGIGKEAPRVEGAREVEEAAADKRKEIQEEEETSPSQETESPPEPPRKLKGK